MPLLETHMTTYSHHSRMFLTVKEAEKLNNGVDIEKCYVGGASEHKKHGE